MPFRAFFNWNIPQWGEQQGQNAWDWWKNIPAHNTASQDSPEHVQKWRDATYGKRGPQGIEYGTMPERPGPTALDKLRALFWPNESDLMAKLKERDRPMGEIDLMETQDEQYPDDTLRNRGWQQSQLPQGQYYKKPTPDYSDWGW